MPNYQRTGRCIMRMNTSDQMYGFRHQCKSNISNVADDAREPSVAPFVVASGFKEADGAITLEFLGSTGSVVV